jgi:hypothetical protein
MVQPTDKEPSVFQVIYLGVHTCSHTANTRKGKRKVPRGGAVQATADKSANLQQVPSREEQDHQHHRQSPMKPTTAPPMRSVLQHQTDHQPAATTHVAADHQGGQPEITSQLAASAMHDLDEVELAGLETLEEEDFFPLIKLPAPSASSSPVHHHHELQVEDQVVADHELLMGDATSDFPPCSWLDFVSDSFGPPEITNSDMAESVQDSV